MRLLWDFDGTIMDTYPAYTTILYTILQGQYPKDEIYKQLKISQSHAISHFKLTKQQAEEMKQQSRLLTSGDYRPFDGIETILKKVEVNVIMTHMERASVERILQQTNLSQYFKEIVAGDDGFPRKPNAASYAYLHEKYQLDYAIGDRELDLIPAKEIGLGTIMFQGNSPVADYTLDDYRKFEHLVL
ncbi:MAG: HAD-IA family hydrolase [Kurthia sp.]|nr:HAD-IA family hydrolase [Candidatus Kurthia equi]